jgi:hypothetical protein
VITANHSAALRSELGSEDIVWIGEPLHPTQLFDAIHAL